MRQGGRRRRRSFEQQAPLKGERAEPLDGGLECRHHRLVQADGIIEAEQGTEHIPAHFLRSQVISQQRLLLLLLLTIVVDLPHRDG